MLYYLMTGFVKFSKLRSNSRAAYLSDPGPNADILPLEKPEYGAIGNPIFGLKSPPSCSPKSLYALADAYRLEDLRDEALKAIVSQLTPQNVLLDIFSNFSGKYEVVCDKEVSYLFENWDKVKTSHACETLLENEHILCDTANHKKAWKRIMDALIFP